MKKYLLLLLTLGWVVFACEKDNPKTVAQLTTTGVTEITQTTAVAGGNVTHDGGASVTVRGVCWSTGQTPTINDSKTTNGSGVGSFSSSIMGLEPNTTYFARAYATNSEGTGYGKAISFKTLVAIKLPTLTTLEITDITQTTAISGGVVSDDGGAAVTARGVCWSKSETPTVNDSKTTNGTGTGSFSSNIANLESNTTYYVRAYATNSEGTSYGNATSFKTLVAIELPTITTTEVTEIRLTTAVSGGEITNDGGASVTARGVCWSTSETPTMSDSKTEDGEGSGKFISNISNLKPNTTYYVRAFATNKEGTSYGDAISFKTVANSFTDPRDDNIYQIVMIGEQVWMAENLKYLPSVVSSSIVSTSTPYYYVYGYNGVDVSAAKVTNNYKTYGALYNWSAAMAGSISSNTNPSGVQGVCPTGWHLPSDAEWTELTDYLGGESIAGGKLKETGTKHWNSPNKGATNETGFAALPGGSRDVYGAFNHIGIYGSWWSATEKHKDDNEIVFFRSMLYNDISVGNFFLYKAWWSSVRCVKD